MGKPALRAWQSRRILSDGEHGPHALAARPFLDSASRIRYNPPMGFRFSHWPLFIHRPRLGALLRAITALLVLWGSAACAVPQSTPTAPPTAAQRQPPAQATVRIVTTPVGASILLDSVDRGQTPQTLTLPAGRYRLRLEKAGDAPQELDLVAQEGRELLIHEVLRDIVPPSITLAPLPQEVAPEEGLKIVAQAEDNAQVAHLALWLDGRLLHEVNLASLRYNVDTRALAPGEHEVVIQAQDDAGNTARVGGRFTVRAPTPAPSATATLIATPTSTPRPTATITPTPQPTATRPSPVSASWGEITIATYAYEQALYTDPERVGHPYPLLRREAVGPPRPRTYRVLRLRNAYVELTFLPELGGRIYQCRYLPTGQDLFYNNRVIKPSHWGPADQGWWLAVGGIEFCLPVDEHGYSTAEPWEPEVRHGADGSATVVLRFSERSRRIEAQVEVTLRPGEAGFTLRSTLHNPDPQTKSCQYWINAMLSPGAPSVQPSLRFYYPAAEVIVHSRGDPALPDARQVMSWPVYQGRDLSLYANWRDWLGFFAPTLQAPFTAVYDEAAQLGLVRVFPPEVAKGVKLFGFGLGFGDSGAYTDDGSQYVEMWGGLTPTFWDYANLPPQATVSWEESWYVLAQSGGPTLANAAASLHVARREDAIELTIASPRENRWTVVVTQGDRTLAQQPIVVGPTQPSRLVIALGAAGSAQGVTVRLVDAAGRTALSWSG